MSAPITLRRATNADLPRMTRILVDAFAQGPWGRFLFPPHLKVNPGDADELAWRQYTIASGLDSPARDTVVACQEGLGGNGEEEIVGWAQWIDLAAPKGSGLNPEEMKAKMDRDLGPNPAGLDTAALDTLRSEGQQLEKSFEEFLGTERAKASLRELFSLYKPRLKVQWLISTASTELNYLCIDPKHQRKGIGRLLAKEGLERAASQGRDVCLRSTPEGRLLYLALGFVQVCEQKVVRGSQYAMVLKAPNVARTE